MNSLIYWT